MKIEEIKERKARMEQALRDCNIALSHDEYSMPFIFKRMDRMSESMVNHPLLKTVVSVCVERNIGFDPSLAIQHIEREALEQFNQIILTRIKGTGIPTLMEMRHELELLMLKDQKEHYTRECAKAEKQLIEAVIGVEASVIDVDASSNRKESVAESSQALFPTNKPDVSVKKKNKK